MSALNALLVCVEAFSIENRLILSFCCDSRRGTVVYTKAGFVVNPNSFLPVKLIKLQRNSNEKNARRAPLQKERKREVYFKEILPGDHKLPARETVGGQLPSPGKGSERYKKIHMPVLAMLPRNGHVYKRDGPSTSDAASTGGLKMRLVNNRQITILLVTVRQ